MGRNKPQRTARSTDPFLVYQHPVCVPRCCRLSCQLDKALANVGALLSTQVEGRVCTEIDPRLANDKGEC